MCTIIRTNKLLYDSATNMRVFFCWWMFLCRFEFEVEENAPPFTEVGRVTVQDLDLPPHDRVAFYLNRSASGGPRMFRIHSDTGRLYTLRPLDRELQSFYLLIVGIRSVSLRSSATAQVKVTVSDVNDCAPMWVFPRSPDNDNVHVSFGFGLDEVALTTLVAKDTDDGVNARLRSVLELRLTL